MKRIVAIVVTLIMLVGLGEMQAFASNNNHLTGISCNSIRNALNALNEKEPIDVERYQIIAENDISTLDNYCLLDPNSENYTLEGIDNAGRLIYSTIIGGEPSIIKVDEKRDGTLLLYITEINTGNQDVIMVTKDGTLFLNNKKVEINTIDKDGFTLASPAVTSYTKSPQYGKASDYSKYINTIKTANVAMKNKFISITVGALTTIVVTFLTRNLSFTKQVCTGVASGIASGLLSVGKKYAPNSAYFSCIVKKYGLSDKKRPSSVVGTFYCFKGTYYVKSNYKGSSYSYTCYENKYPTPGV